MDLLPFLLNMSSDGLFNSSFWVTFSILGQYKQIKICQILKEKTVKQINKENISEQYKLKDEN